MFSYVHIWGGVWLYRCACDQMVIRSNPEVIRMNLLLDP